MVFSNYPNNSSKPLVADTSVMINLNATGCADIILKAYADKILITRQVLFELNRGEINGHKDGEKIKALIDHGIVKVIDLGEKGVKIYESLITGTTSDTLDDGEASTIGCVNELEGAIVIDERKANSICSRKYPNLEAYSTIDILTSAPVKNELGKEKQSEAIFNALKNARMNVPHERAKEIIEIIGADRAAQCRTLSRYLK